MSVSDHHVGVVAACWREVLRLDSIAAGDEFFELGGSSLDLIRVVVLLNERGYDVDLDATLDGNPVTPSVMATRCRPYVTLPNAPSPVGAPLFQVPFHRRSFATPDDNRNQFVALMTFFVDCEDGGRLSQALESLVAATDALRIRSLEEPGGWKMYVAEVGGYTVRQLDGRSLPQEELESQARSIARDLLLSIDIAAPRLVAALAVRHRDSLHQILMYVHHAVCDRYSTDLLREQIQGFLSGRVDAIREPPVPYAAYARAVESYLAGEGHRRTIEAYLARSEIHLAPALRVDRPDAEHTGESVRFLHREVRLPDEDRYRVHRNLELLATGAAALATAADPRWTHLALAHHGRLVPVGLNLAQTVGYLVQQLQLFLDLERVRRESLDYLGEEAARMRPIALDVESILFTPDRYDLPAGALPLPRLVVQYNGDVEAEDGLSLARAAMGIKVGSGEVVKDFVYFLSLWVDRARGSLIHRWEYSANQCDEATIEAIAQSFDRSLAALVRTADERQSLRA